MFALLQRLLLTQLTSACSRAAFLLWLFDLIGLVLDGLQIGD